MKSTVLILGATGVVGRGIVAAAVESGLAVIAVARGREALDALRAEHAAADITVVPGAVETDAGSAALASALRALGRPLDGVIVAVAGVPRRGRVLDEDTASMRAAIESDLLPHVAAARHLLPLMAEGGRGGSYVLIGGPAGALPWAGYGLRSVAAAAVRMLACVLHDEARSLGVRVQLLAVDAPVCRPGVQSCPQWPTAMQIGRRAIALVERSDARDAARPIVAYATGLAATDQQRAQQLLRSIPLPNANEASPHEP